jgi:hypothetical protein
MIQLITNRHAGTFQQLVTNCNTTTAITLYILSRLGGVVVSVLATGPKGPGYKAGQGDGFLSAIKVRSSPSFGGEVRPEILQHVKFLA